MNVRKPLLIGLTLFLFFSLGGAVPTFSPNSLAYARSKKVVRSHKAKPKKRSTKKPKRKSVKKRSKKKKNQEKRKKHSKPIYPGYRTVNNKSTKVLNNYTWTATGSSKKHTLKSISGPRMIFRTLGFLPNHVNHTNFIQSVVAAPNGKTALLAFDMSDDTHPNGWTKIAKVSLQPRKNLRILQFSKPFYGGHGQAIAYDPKQDQIWLMVTKLGPLHRGFFEEFNAKTLKPMKRRIYFNLNKFEWYGNDLAFDRKGIAYTESRIRSWNKSRPFKENSIVIYRGLLRKSRMPLKLVNQGIRKAPGRVTQGMTYNPRNNQLYFETDGAFQSLPVNKIGRLKPKDVKETIFKNHREFEGLSFDQKGYAYLALNRPNEVLKSSSPIK